MTARSVECEIGGEKYQLRFDRADVKALEQRLAVGYLYFLNPSVFTSMTAMEAFIHRGLRQENRMGELEHVFAMTSAGENEAGDLLFAHMEDADKLRDRILEAFIACGLFKKLENSTKEGEDPKN